MTDTRHHDASPRFVPTEDERRTDPTLAACAAEGMSERETIAQLHLENVAMRMRDAHAMPLRPTPIHTLHAIASLVRSLPVQLIPSVTVAMNRRDAYEMICSVSGAHRGTDPHPRRPDCVLEWANVRICGVEFSAAYTRRKEG